MDLFGNSGTPLSPTELLSEFYMWLVADFKANPITKSFSTWPTQLDGYTPRNQKLRTYPYLYIGFNPPNGSQKIYRYEDFTNGVPTFKIYSEVTQNPSVVFIPQNYRGQSGNSLNDKVVLNGYPTIGWITDYFNTWLAQNSQIISLNMEQEKYNYQVDAIKQATNTMSNIVGTAMRGNADLSVLNGINFGLDMNSLDRNHEFYVKQQMAQIEKQEMLPNSGSLSPSNATLLRL